MNNQVKSWKPHPGPQTRFHQRTEFEVMYGGARGGGKAQPNYVKILTFSGWKQLFKCKVGDYLINPVTGGTSKIIKVFPQGTRYIYRLTFDDGAIADFDLDHLWYFKLPNHHRPGGKKAKQRDYVKNNLGIDTYPKSSFEFFRIGTTDTLRKYLDKGFAPRIPLTAPVLFQKNGRTGTGNVLPYLVGLYLGDGSCSDLSIATADIETANYLESLGFTKRSKYSYKLGASHNLYILLDRYLRNHGLRHARSHTKFIPEYVFTAPIDYRIDFLGGLLDTDGYVDDRGHVEFTSTSRKLVKGVQELVWGLGGKATISEPITGAYKNDFGEKIECKQYWRVYIWLPFASKVFKLKRKVERCIDQWNGGYENMRKVVDISYVGKEEATCIKVSSPHGLYITDDYIVTHNSESLLIEALRYIHLKDYRALIMRRTFPQLQELIDRSKRLFSAAIPEAQWKEQERRWLFPSGAILRMGHMEHEDDKYQYMGHEYQYIGFDELTHFTHTQYLFLMGSCRSTNPDLPARIRATTNPGNIGHEWVKARFVDPAPPETVIKDEITGLERIFIPATVYDNPTLMKNDPQYVKRLESIPDEKIRRMMLYGDWDVYVGQAFGDFKRDVHVIKPFEVPVEWKKFIAVDWGYSRPFAVYWIAQDLLDRLYVYNEWYGVALDERGQPKPNIGIELDAFNVAVGILQRCNPGFQYDYCVMDSKMWSPSGIGDASVAGDFERAFAERGIPLIKAQQTPGSRIAGKQQLHSRLRIRADGKPGIFFTENCLNLIRTLPYLPTDQTNPEDVDTHAEDHAFDALKYGLLTCPSTERVILTSDGTQVSTAEIESFRRRKRFNKMRAPERGLVHTYHSGGSMA